MEADRGGAPPGTKPPKMNTNSLAALAIGIAGAFLIPPAALADAGDELANAILSHVREDLPPSVYRGTHAEKARVRSFADVVVKGSTGAPLQALKAAALRAIDAAQNESATEASLDRAAMAGVLDSIGHGARLYEPTEEDVGSRSQVYSSQASSQTPGKRQIRLPSFHDVDTTRVISLPNLKWTRCPDIDDYFDIPTSSGITGLVIDLRGNDGGLILAGVCVASHLLPAGRRVFEITGRFDDSTVESVKVGKHKQVMLPVAIFIDKQTDAAALALAAALQDQRRATIIGEAKESVNGAVLTYFVTFGRQDLFTLPTGDIRRLGGARLEDGIKVDTVVSPQDAAALMEAAHNVFAAAGHEH